MLRKQFRYGLMVLLLSTTAFAQEPGPFNEQDTSYPSPATLDAYIATQAPVAPISNAYIGLLLGADLTQIKFTTISSLDPGIPNYTANKASVFGSGGIYGGYGTNFNNFYLAGEASVTYNYPAYKNTTVFSSTGLLGSPTIALSSRMPVTGSLDVLPGYITDNQKVIFFARLGGTLSCSELKLNITNPGANGNSSNASTKVLSGLRVGAGIEYFTADYFSIRMDYIYSVYGSFSVTNTGGALGVPYTYKMKPTNNQVNFGFAFHF
jgi:opacity protein-like surface antigen